MRAEADLGIVDSRRRHAMIRQGARRAQQALARAGEHEIARRKILETVIDDRPHALGHRLVLEMDTLDAAEAARALERAVLAVIIAGILREPPAAVPIGRVRQIVEGE